MDVSQAVIRIFEEKGEEGIVGLAAAMSANLTQLQNTRYEKNYLQLLDCKYFLIVNKWQWLRSLKNFFVICFC